MAKSAENEYFSDIGHCLKTLLKIDKKKAKEIYSCIPEPLMVLKGTQSGSTFIGLTRGLSDLSKVNFYKTFNIATMIGLNVFEEKARDPNIGFSQISHGLILLNNLSPTKSKQLLNAIGFDNLLSLANQLNFFSFSQAINQINIISPKIARSLLTKINISPITDISDIDDFSIVSFSKSLSELSNLDMGIAWEIYNKIECTAIVKHVKNDIDTLSKLGQTMSVFKKIDPKKTRSIFNQMSTSELLVKSQHGGFTGITLGISSLNKIDKKKITALLSLLDISFFVKKAEERRVTFNGLATGLSLLESVDTVFAAKIFRSIDLTIIRKKALKCRTENIIREKAFKVLSNIDSQKASEIFNQIN